MRDGSSVSGNSGQLEQHELSARVPLRAPAGQDKASAWLITIKRPIRVKWVTPQGFKFAPSVHLDDKKKTSRSMLKESGASSTAANQHDSHTVGV